MILLQLGLAYTIVVGWRSLAYSAETIERTIELGEYRCPGASEQDQAVQVRWVLVERPSKMARWHPPFSLRWGGPSRRKHGAKRYITVE